MQSLFEVYHYPNSFYKQYMFPRKVPFQYRPNRVRRRPVIARQTKDRFTRKRLSPVIERLIVYLLGAGAVYLLL